MLNKFMNTRETTGLFLAPAPLPILGLVLGEGLEDLDFQLTLILCYGGMFLIGFPAIYILKYFKKYSFGWLFGAGILSGVVTVSAFVFIFNYIAFGNPLLDEELFPGGLSWQLQNAFIAGVVFGALTALFYSAIASVWKNKCTT